MNDDLMELYHQMILEHGKRPRNFGGLEDAERSADGHNPLCGDRCRVDLDVEGYRVKRVSFSGEGCAISTASASLMTEAIKGRSVREVKEVFERFHDQTAGDVATGVATHAASSCRCSSNNRR